MNKIKITKDGASQEVKERYLPSFVAKGWKVESNKKVSKIGIAKATADVIEEVNPQPKKEEESSMPNINKGDD
jgi:hypothetical protein